MKRFLPALLTLLFLGCFSAALAAPTIFFDPGTELMPSCVPGSCTVRTPVASSSASGILSAADWNAFNGKQEALGYVPYDAANPNGYLSSSSIVDSTDVSLSSPVAGNFLRYDGALWINAALSVTDIPSLDMSKITTGNLNWSRITSTPATLAGYGITDSVVNSFNARTGNVTLTSSDVTTTLGYIPYDAANPNDYISSSSIASATDVGLASLAAGNFLRYDGATWANAALSAGDIPNLDMSKIATGHLDWARVTSTPATLAGYGIMDLLVNSFNGRSGVVALSSSDVTSTLGYIPYDASNPDGYISSSSIGNSTDVSLSSPVSGNLLKYDGANWTNGGLLTTDIPNLDMAKVTTGSLSWARVTSTPTSISGYGITDSLVNTFNARAGAVTLTSTDITTTLGYVPYDLANPANYITLGSLSAAAPLLYDNSSGIFSLPKASSTANGYLSSADWSTFNNKLTSTLSSGNIFLGNGSNLAAEATLSGDAALSNMGVITIATSAVTSAKILDGAIQNVDLASSSFATLLGTSGTDINFSAASTSLGGVLTLNVPNAGAAARGLVSTGTQSIAGDKTFLGSTTFKTTVANDDTLVLVPNSGGALSFAGNIGSADLTAPRTWTLPNASGVLMLTSDTLPLNQLAAAGATNAIDSLNFGQTWNWSTANTQNPFTLVAAGLTSGNLLSLNSTSTSHTGNVLVVSDASIGAFTNGGVLFNFTGAHTGNGLQVSDVTASGNALAIIANSLTSGTGLSLLSSSAALTGDLAKIEATGSNSSITGNAVKVGFTGSSASGTVVNVTNAGTGLALRVNDDGTYTDSSPFVINAGGSVGIGTTNPSSALHVIGKVTASLGFNGQCVSAGTFALALGNACNQDIAESYATFEATEPGDVVVIPPPEEQEMNASNEAVVKAGRSRSVLGETLLGVVSTNPGLVFRNGFTHLAGANDQFISPTSTVVALAGRVPVKVSLENGPIRAGDELAVSKDVVGTAARASGPGFVLGIALESYVDNDSSDAAPQVLMFVEPHWSLGNLRGVEEIAAGPDAPDQFTAYIQHALRALGMRLNAGIAVIEELVARKITAEELCLEEVCITKDQLQDLLQQNNMPQYPTTPVIQQEAVVEEQLPEVINEEMPLETSQIPEDPEHLPAPTNEE